MNKDNLFDNEIKKRLKEETNFIPENINKAFDEAMEKGKSNRARRSYKKVAQIASVFVLGVLVFGVTISPYAKNIPILKNIYETFNRKTYENYDKYASDIDITKESKGISVTINKVIYDGFSLEVFYTVESNEPMKATPYFRDLRIKINGDETSFGWGSGGEFLEDDKVYVGNINYGIDSRSLLPKEFRDKFKGVDIPDEFILSLEINKIQFANEDKAIMGKWNFDIPVSNEKLKGEVKEREVNIDFSNIQDGLTINKIITTPINTVLQGYDCYAGDNMSNFIVFDDKGRALANKSGDGTGVGTEDGGVANYFSKKVKEVYDDTKALTIIPYVTIFERDKNAEKNNVQTTELTAVPQTVMKASLNLDGETKLFTNDGKEYGVITKVENKDDKGYIYFKPTISNYTIFEKIVEENNDTNISYPVDNYYENEETTTRYNKETGEFVIEFTKPLKDSNYVISYYDNSRSEVYHFDKAVTVDIKNN